MTGELRTRISLDITRVAAATPCLGPRRTRRVRAGYRADDAVFES